KDSEGPPWGQMVAFQADTKVQIVSPVALPSGANVTGAPANHVTTYTLGAGEYIQWELSTDMTGGVIQSDKPIALTGGNAYICYTSATSDGGGCESAHQMIPPVSALGYDYVAPPYKTRITTGAPESIPYRIVGAVDGTQLSYDPALPGAPTTVG